MAKSKFIQINGVHYRLGYYTVFVYKIGDEGWVWLGDEAPDPRMVVTGIVDGKSDVYEVQLPSGQSMQVHASRLLQKAKPVDKVRRRAPNPYVTSL